jgi:hypothetical protein
VRHVLSCSQQQWQCTSVSAESTSQRSLVTVACALAQTALLSTAALAVTQLRECLLACLLNTNLSSIRQRAQQQQQRQSVSPCFMTSGAESQFFFSLTCSACCVCSCSCCCCRCFACYLCCYCSSSCLPLLAFDNAGFLSYSAAAAECVRQHILQEQSSAQRAVGQVQPAKAVCCCRLTLEITVRQQQECWIM